MVSLAGSFTACAAGFSGWEHFYMAGSRLAEALRASAFPSAERKNAAAKAVSGCGVLLVSAARTGAVRNTGKSYCAAPFGR